MGLVAKVRGRESGDDQLELMPLNEVVHERSTTTSLSTLEEFSSSDGPTAVVPGVIRLRYIVHETIERSTVAHCNEGDTGHKALCPVSQASVNGLCLLCKQERGFLRMIASPVAERA